jgi:uncharacterized repeat protein (TIGR01451 family)
VPASVGINFLTTTGTFTQPDIALQPYVVKDTIRIKLTPITWAARPGFSYPYRISYENIGTNSLTPIIYFEYNGNLLTYDSSSRVGVTSSTNTLTYNQPLMYPGQFESWIAYFRVKANAPFLSFLYPKATATYANGTSADSLYTSITGSYDPNDKRATPQLTTTEVAQGRFIDYTIRFQNTGNDTAFTVVLTDTLSSLLQHNTLQVVEASHTCKTSMKDGVLYFEFVNIKLPDSGRNNLGSNGFISFRIRPISTVVNNTVINNKAGIYFDYNDPIITNIASTQITNPPLPLKLLALSAITQGSQQIMVYFNTTNEYNTGYFEIEQSIDAITFIKSATVPSFGNGSHNYYASIAKNFINNNQANLVYIRLKIFDKDGKFIYSNVVRLSAKIDKADLEVINNPAKDVLNVLVKTTLLHNTNAQLINNNGAVIKNFILKEGLQSISISNLAAGVYYLQCNAGSKQIIITH